jgi:NADPH:quinone reductase-like Zn-dependent oxidoreductase
MTSGAGGGVGTFAVQVAKWLGAEVTAACGPGKVDTVRSLGADRKSDLRRHAELPGRPTAASGGQRNSRLAVLGPEGGGLHHAAQSGRPARPEELIESGEITPVVDRTYPLSETQEAMRYLEEGRVRGKVVITI